ncbi:MAG TPA: homocysteine S-methyltransferase family protein [Anaerolineae bacterium]|nr:homocysteine S-methyltransferase family protein [Anaerolineae bacterium]
MHLRQEAGRLPGRLTRSPDSPGTGRAHGKEKLVKATLKKYNRVESRLWECAHRVVAAKDALEALCLGARVVGECCGTSPEHIAAIVAAFRR